MTMDHYHVSRYSSSFRPAARAAGTGACFVQKFRNFCQDVADFLLNVDQISRNFVDSELTKNVNYQIFCGTLTI